MKYLKLFESKNSGIKYLGTVYNIHIRYDEENNKSYTIINNVTYQIIEESDSEYENNTGWTLNIMQQLIDRFYFTNDKINNSDGSYINLKIDDSNLEIYLTSDDYYLIALITNDSNVYVFLCDQYENLVRLLDIVKNYKNIANYIIDQIS